MIPLHLTLKNFLSYREAALDFDGLHVACICGANGAGKSSLLEAIAWAVWGQSRAVSEDDVIHLGEKEARVDFIFRYHQHIYRIIRTRYRGQASSLEFQVQTSTGFRPLTERGMRATQQFILQHLKLDYETFINSAYLRQGRADEFMLKRPIERKQILADLLKLDQYDELAEKAKERSRQAKAELTVIERSLDTISQQLNQEPELIAADQVLREQLGLLQAQYTHDTEQLDTLHQQVQQQQTLHHELQLHRQQYGHLQQEQQRLRQELQGAMQQKHELEQILQETAAIAQGYAQLQQLQAAEDEETQTFHQHQAILTRRQQLQQQMTEAVNDLNDQQRQVQTALEHWRQQEQELRHSLRKVDDVNAAFAQLQQARSQLEHLDQLQLQATPLLQRRHTLQLELERLRTRLQARYDELHSLTQMLQQQQQQQPSLQQAVVEVSQQVDYLEQRRHYQQKVREKGLERRNFLERLQERQRDLERQLSELDQKIHLLKRQPMEGNGQGESLRNHSRDEQTKAALEHDGTALLQVATVQPLPLVSFPPCPLCDRPLDEQHWALVLEKHQAERQEILDQLWVLREQLTTSDREIKVLRQEYRNIEKELAHYGTVLERRGQLQEQLQTGAEAGTRLTQLVQEQATIERSLQTHVYAPELHDELLRINQRLEELNYDDKTHALARGEADRWRWADIKHAELKQAQKRLAQLLDRKPALEAELEELEAHRRVLQASPLQQQIQALDRQLAAIAYNVEHHTQLRTALRQAQGWQLRYQALGQAQQQMPQVQQRIYELSGLLKERSQMDRSLQQQIKHLSQQLEQYSHCQTEIDQLTHQMQQRRAQLDDGLAQLGRLQQQQRQIETLKHQQVEYTQQAQELRRQMRIYQELAQAFSKNGIQALMIENILPQLEAETNHLLGRLSNHQLHVQFVTQRTGRGKSNSRNPKLIDTLDILINDAHGTRPYETYSGGEAFRINFAIRLALARLLAQRAGTPLQLLIIDEGFGTQDALGCDRLIHAINAIASDFACILAVTHMPQLKEAFQTRIEVSKAEQGSYLNLSV